MTRTSVGSRFNGLAEILRCPRGRGPLTRESGAFIGTGRSWPDADGVPDLRSPPDRLRLDLRWVEPWTEIREIDLSRPTPLDAEDIPPSMDPYKAAMVGEEGDGRVVLEVGCGFRKSEPYFIQRGFSYVGTDVEVRGPGPDVLCDAHNLPFVDECIDVYFSQAVYEHLMCPLVALDEAYRVLKPGGCVMCACTLMYGFHDHASFFNCTHGGLITMLRQVGFEQIRIWPGWDFTDSVPGWCYKGRMARPWYWSTRFGLKFAEASYIGLRNLAGRMVGMPPIDRVGRRGAMAGGLNFFAVKPRTEIA